MKDESARSRTWRVFLKKSILNITLTLPNPDFLVRMRNDRLSFSLLFYLSTQALHYKEARQLLWSISQS